MTNKETGEEFRRLLADWHDATGGMSALGSMFAHPSYQAIIALGPSVVPHILRHMKTEPDHLGWALHKITGAQPVPNEHAGMLHEMASDWIAWGRASGYLEST